MRKNFAQVWASRRSVLSDAPPRPVFEPASPTPLAPRARGPVPHLPMPNASATGLHRSPGSSAALGETPQAKVSGRDSCRSSHRLLGRHIGISFLRDRSHNAHGWFLLFAANRPRVNLKRPYSRQARPRRSQPLHQSADPPWPTRCGLAPGPFGGSVVRPRSSRTENDGGRPGAVLGVFAAPKWPLDGSTVPRASTRRPALGLSLIGVSDRNSFRAGSHCVKSVIPVEIRPDRVPGRCVSEPSSNLNLSRTHDSISREQFIRRHVPATSFSLWRTWSHRRELRRSRKM